MCFFFVFLKRSILLDLYRERKLFVLFKSLENVLEKKIIKKGINMLLGCIFFFFKRFPLNPPLSKPKFLTVVSFEPAGPPRSYVGVCATRRRDTRGPVRTEHSKPADIISVARNI